MSFEVFSQEVTPQAELSFTDMFDRWVASEGDRYRNLLIERGFLLAEEADRPDIYKAAMEEIGRAHV